MRILFALLSALAGLLLVFGGYRLARVLIPFVGFISGLALGGAVAADLSNEPFLGTVLGVVVGLAAGLAFAVLAYFYYALAIILLAGSLGYWAGSSFILWLGFSPGLLSALAGIGLGVLVGLLSLLANAPKFVLIALTSIVGTVASIGGLMLLFNQIPLEAYSYNTVRILIDNSFIWTVSGFALLVLGVAAQVRSTQNYTFMEWSLDDDIQHSPPTTPVTHLHGSAG